MCAWNVFVLLFAWLVPQFLMLFYFMLLRRCLQGLSHDNREVKFSTAFSWLSCSSSICLCQISLSGYNSFLLLSNWCLVFFQRSFTLILEAWDWDNDTKAGEYLCKAWTSYLLCAVCVQIGEGENCILLQSAIPPHQL